MSGRPIPADRSAEDALAAAIHETCDWEHYMGHEPSERDDMLAASLIPALQRRGFALSSTEAGRLREALEEISAEGCEAAAFYAGIGITVVPGWDSCLEPNNREEPLTGDLLQDRCSPCIARAALESEAEHE